MAEVLNRFEWNVQVATAQKPEAVVTSSEPAPQKRMVLCGAGGFVALKHLEAMKVTHCQLLGAYDPHDGNMQRLDQFFPGALYFSDKKLFLNWVREQNALEPIDYLVVTAPDHAHMEWIKTAQELRIPVLCEKPLVMNRAELDEVTSFSGSPIYSVFQARFLPEIQKMKLWVDHEPTQRRNVSIEYITSRGPWYWSSWRGDQARAAGAFADLAIHFVDVLTYLFGSSKSFKLDEASRFACRGKAELERADIEWEFSSKPVVRPGEKNPIYSRRLFKIDGNDFDFTRSFEQGHIILYQHLLRGEGIPVQDVRATLDLVFGVQGGMD